MKRMFSDSPAAVNYYTNNYEKVLDDLKRLNSADR